MRPEDKIRNVPSSPSSAIRDRVLEAASRKRLSESPSFPIPPKMVKHPSQKHYFGYAPRSFTRRRSSHIISTTCARSNGLSSVFGALSTAFPTSHLVACRTGLSCDRLADGRFATSSNIRQRPSPVAFRCIENRQRCGCELVRTSTCPALSKL